MTHKPKLGVLHTGNIPDPFVLIKRLPAGNSLNASLGVRYVGLDIIVPQIQLNFRDIQRDSGPRADTVSTGGMFLYISPGLIAAVSDQVSLYAFVQVPIYQDLNGVQLAPQFIPSVGVRNSF